MLNKIGIEIERGNSFLIFEDLNMERDAIIVRFRDVYEFYVSILKIRDVLGNFIGKR